MFNCVTEVGRTVIASGPRVFPGRNRAFPALERLQNGDLLVAYREGTDHWVTPDGVVRLVRSTDGGRTWSGPTTLVQCDGWNCGTHQGLAQLSNGNVMLPYTRLRWGPERCGYPTQAQEIWLLESTDNGHSWGEPRKLGPRPGWIWQNQYGRIMEPSPGEVWVSGGGQKEGEAPHPLADWRAGFHRSEDYGTTWTDYVEVAKGLVDEMSLVRLPSGRWLAMIRPGREAGPDLYRSYSEDGGRTWSTPERSGVWGACPCLFLTTNGLLLCAYSDARPGRAAGTSLSYSRDEGATWAQEDEQIYTTSAQGGSYPSMVYVDSRRILCAYYTQYNDRVTPVDTNCNIEGVFFEENTPC